MQVKLAMILVGIVLLVLGIQQWEQIGPSGMAGYIVGGAFLVVAGVVWLFVERRNTRVAGTPEAIDSAPMPEEAMPDSAAIPAAPMPAITDDYDSDRKDAGAEA